MVIASENHREFASLIRLWRSVRDLSQVELADLVGQSQRDISRVESSSIIPGKGLVTRLSKHDTNPENNPQMPERYRK